MSVCRIPWLLALLVPAMALARPLDDAPVPAPTPIQAAAPAPAAPPSPAQILAIPAPLQALLQQRVIAPGYGREQRVERLVHLIFDDDGMGLRYDPYATQTLTETWENRRANCLSFTLLFVTLARAAGIDARVQEVAQVVTWYEDEGVIYNVGHVNAGVNFRGRMAVVDLDRNVLYDRYGPQPVSEQRALAHFYNNRGAMHLTDGDPVQARAYLQAALAQDPAFVSGWNNLGVLDARSGNLAQAEHDYRIALQLKPRNAASLTNAAALYRRLGDSRQAALLAKRLQQVQRDDPFAQFRLGNQAEQRHDYAAAIRYYRQAVRLYDSAHQFHFGLARVYFLAGDNRRASREMARARDLAGDTGAALKARYQAKLDSLARWRQHAAGIN
ncbi:tetratricopeptide repeat protein [Stenotrophomonas sp.]|uniref:tetratricopeptide repeat protein n=1 Tax=Stenotrophomonas sp. TaxID=69392 RepID=UPI002FC6A480